MTMKRKQLTFLTAIILSMGLLFGCNYGKNAADNDNNIKNTSMRNTADNYDTLNDTDRARNIKDNNLNNTNITRDVTDNNNNNFDNTYRTRNVAATNDNDDDDNDMDWGWLGLIGLAGLFGRRRRDNDRKD
jgi:MYXO-CTERM domain-containing protein